MSKPCILVVEDEFIVAQDLMASLTNMGYRVCDNADTGEKAIQSVERRPPDLVIMDIVLKGQMDGIEAAAQIHERFQIPVIFLSAFGNQALLDRAKSIEPFAYLIKPFNENELHSAVEIGLYRANMEKKLRRSEKRFKTITELLPTGIFELDRANKVIFMNTAGFKMLGVSQQDFESGINFKDYLIAGGSASARSCLNGSLADCGAGPSEYQVLRKDGSQIAVIANFTTMPKDPVFEDPADQVGGTVVNLTDITPIKKLENQLHQAQKMEAVGRLAGGIAHDFNNLLYVILGYSEILMQNIDTSHPHYEGLKEINNASERARMLVRQLLAFGRKQVLNVNWVDINQVINDFEKLLRRIIGEDIKLEIRLMNKPAVVKADITQIEQVLMNLAVNARDAMPDGGLLTIETGVINLDEYYTSSGAEITPGNYIMIQVSDNGVGMDAETIARIFDPFFTTKATDVGTGLGLSTVYGIVKQHDGHISVYSEPDRGTVFKILLPHYAKNAVEEAPQPPQPKPIEGSETILVVEDDPAVLRMTGKILANAGYHVLEAGNASDGVHLAQTHEGKLHLLLTDIIMPDMKGPEVYQHVREYHPEIRALYMSGYTADIVTRHGILKEGLQFVQKPFSAKVLLSKVGELISQ